MPQCIGRVLLSVILLAGPVGSAAAQQLSVAGGVALPQGDLNQVSETGWHALASLTFGSVMQPLGIRLDAAYNRFPLVGSGHLNAGSATLNVTYRVPRATWPVSPYLILGLGAYRTDCSLSGCEGDTSFGWNAGLGAKIHPLGIFLEARYHRTGREGEGVHYFPLSVGLRLF